MKKRIISFALAFVFCFCCLATVSLADEDAHIHAATTLSFVSATETTLTYAIPDSGYLTVSLGGTVKCSSKTMTNTTVSGNNYVFSGLTANTTYTVSYYATNTATAATATESKATSQGTTATAATISAVSNSEAGKLELTINKVANHQYSLTSNFATTVEKFPLSYGGSTTVYSRIGTTGTAVSSVISLPTVTFTTSRSGNDATINYTVNANSFTISGGSVEFTVRCGTGDYKTTVTGINVTAGQTVSGSGKVTNAGIGSYTGTAYYIAEAKGTILGSSVTFGKSADNAVLGTSSSSSNKISHNSTTHTTCPTCGNCATLNCVLNLYGCNGTASGCGKTGATTVKVTHNATTHTACPICGACTYANCENNIYGCNGTVNGCAKPSSSTTTKTVKHQLFSKTTVTCPYCGKIDWGDLTWTIYPCSTEAKTAGASCFYICQQCRTGIVFLTWEASECTGAHTYTTRTQDKNGYWIEYCDYCSLLHTCENQTPCGHAESKYALITTGINCEVTSTWTYKCTLCSKTYTAAHKSSAHTWNAGTVTKAAGATTDGVKTYTCTTCGLTKTETIPATDPCAKYGHKYGEWVTVKSPTCTADGQQERTCSVCNGKETNTLAKLGHTYGAWTLTKAATCTEAGIETQTCSRCQGVNTRSVAVVGHTYGEWFTVTAATCVSEGSEKKVCTVCGDAQTRTVAATGLHTFASDVSTPSVKTCVSCGLSYSVSSSDTGATVFSFTEKDITLTIPKTTVSSFFYTASKQSASAYSEWIEILRSGEAVSEDASFVGGYKAELTDNKVPVDLTSDMEVTLKVSEDLSKNKLKVFALTEDGSLTPVSSVTREGTSVTFSASEEYTGEFFVMAEKQNSTAPIVIAIIVVVLVAGIGGFFLYKKGFFSI